MGPSRRRPDAHNAHKAGPRPAYPPSSIELPDAEQEVPICSIGGCVRHRPGSVDLRWLGALGRLSQPRDDFSINLIRIVHLEVVHPVLRRWMHHFFPPRRNLLTTERYGQDHFSVGVPQVLAGQPQVGEATISPERNLTLCHPDIDATKFEQLRFDSLEDRQPYGVIRKEVLGCHSAIAARPIRDHVIGGDREPPRAIGTCRYRTLGDQRRYWPGLGDMGGWSGCLLAAGAVSHWWSKALSLDG
jgi:hypothetical protein